MKMVLNRFKRCSTSFIIREIQIKTAKRYNFSLIILAGKNLTYSVDKIQSMKQADGNAKWYPQ